MSQNSELVILLEDVDLVSFYGYNDSNINALKKKYDMLTITCRGGMIKMKGGKKFVQEAKSKLELMEK